MRTVMLHLSRKDQIKGVGLELREFGEEFDLNEIYQTKRFKAVWFRTISGNIYYLNKERKISSWKENKTFGKGYLHETVLSKTSLNQKLVVGLKFEAPNASIPRRTTNIVEIVALEYLSSNLTGLTPNNIALDFINLSDLS